VIYEVLAHRLGGIDPPNGFKAHPFQAQAILNERLTKFELGAQRTNRLVIGIAQQPQTFAERAVRFFTRAITRTTRQAAGAA
jgi:hypothetical protein